MQFKFDQKALLRDSLMSPTRYSVKKKIGEGGMGVVYEGFDFELRRKVAIKLILKNRLQSSSEFQSATQIRHFRNEARFAAKLQHSNIVNVFRFITLNENWEELVTIDDDIDLEGAPVACIVLQLVDGCPMSHLLSDSKQSKVQRTIAAKTAASLKSGISGESQTHSSNESIQASESKSLTETLDCFSDQRYFTQVARMGSQLAAALAHAHSRKILHNDIKPSNVMIDSQGNALLADFGVASHSDDSWHVGGTREYMAPEVQDGVQSERSEVYALGATLFRMLTNRRISEFCGPDNSQITLRDISSANPSVSTQLAAVIAKCLKNDPKERYSDALSMQKDLDAFLDGRPVSAIPLNNLQQLRLWAKRNPVGAWLAGSTIVALILGIGLTTWQWHVASVETVRANQNAEKEAEAKNKAIAAAKKEEEAKNEALVSAKRSVDVLRIVKDSFGAADPRHGADFQTSAKDVVLDAIRIARKSEVDDIGRLALFTTLSEIAMATGEYELAVNTANDAAKLSIQIHGQRNMETYRARQALGSALYLNRQFDEAESEIIQNIELLKDSTDRELVGMKGVFESNLGTVYDAQGRHQEALDIYESLIAKADELFGKGSKDTLSILHNYGGILNSMERFDEAKSAFYDAWKADLDALGANHPSTLHSMCRYGSALAKTGKVNSAKEILYDCLERYRTKLGPTHRSTLLALKTLSSVCFSNRDYESADPLLRELIDCYKKIYASDHPDLVTEKNNLAIVLVHTKEIEEAIPLLEEVITALSSKHGPRDKRIFAPTNALAWAYKTQGLAEKAVALSETNLKRNVEEFGMDDFGTLNAINTHAAVLCSHKRYSEAIQWLKKALPRAEDLKGREHSFTQQMVKNLGMALRDGSQPQESITFLEEAYRNAKGDRKLSLLRSLRFAHVLAGNGGEFETLAAIDLKQAESTNKSMEVAKVCFRLAKESEKLGNISRAIELIDKHLSYLEEIELPVPTKEASQSFKGELLIKDNQLEEAEKILLAVYSDLSNIKQSEPVRLQLEFVVEQLIQCYEKIDNESEVKKWKQIQENEETSKSKFD